MFGASLRAPVSVLEMIVVRAEEQFNAQSGVSLVELVAVILVIGVVAGLALLLPSSANEQIQRSNAARQLKEAFERARFDSVKRRADGDALRPYAYVQVRADGFTLRTYSDSDANAATAPVAKDQVFPIAPGISIAHYASGTLPLTITLNRRGEPSGGDPRFRVSEARYSSSEVVIVTPTGTVNLVGAAGSNVNFNFANPSLSGNPGAGDTINDDVIVP